MPNPQFDDNDNEVIGAEISAILECVHEAIREVVPGDNAVLNDQNLLHSVKIALRGAR